MSEYVAWRDVLLLSVIVSWTFVCGLVGYIIGFFKGTDYEDDE